MQEEQIRQNKSYGQVGSGERRDSGSVPAATESTQSMIEARYHCEIRLFLLCLGGSMMCRMKNKFWTGASAVLSYHRAPLANCVVEKLIAYTKSKPGVWFTTREQIATYVKNSRADH
jgi:hypothetical protein